MKQAATDTFVCQICQKPKSPTEGFEIQQIQIELLEEIGRKREG